MAGVPVSLTTNQPALALVIVEAIASSERVTVICVFVFINALKIVGTVLSYVTDIQLVVTDTSANGLPAISVPLIVNGTLPVASPATIT